MITVDATIVATALHTLQQELHTTVNWAGWTLTAYSFGIVLMLPLSAKLSIDYGHKKVFLWSIGIFTAASLLCGLASNIFILVFLRSIQALGGAGITPSVTGIIVAHFGKDRDRAVGLFGSIFPIGALIGPIFGGIFVTYWTWREIFFVNVPIGIIVLLLGYHFIPKDPKKLNFKKSRTDSVGLFLIGLGILAGMFAFAYLGEKKGGFFSTTFIGLLLISVILLILFFKHVNRMAQPFIAPLFISGKGFGAVNLINVIYGGAIQGVIALVPLYATNRYGINALNSGTLLVAQGIAAIVLSTVFSFLLRKTGYHVPLYIGVGIIIIGTFLLALPPQFGISAYFWLAFSTFLIGAGMGTISPAARNAGLQLAPSQSATLAALRSMGMQIGEITTISVITAILAGYQNLPSVHSWILISVVGIFILSIPLIKKVPEHKGVW